MRDWFPVELGGEEIQRAYAQRECYGALLDDAAMPRSLRKLAQQQRDEALAEVEDGEPLFERSKYANREVGIVGSHAGQAVHGWKYWQQVEPRGTYGRQLTGDCVSWGTRAAIDIRRAWQAIRRSVNELKTLGAAMDATTSEVLARAEKYYKRQATALLYSGRGHTGQGANCARISAWACKQPILLEMDYGEVAGVHWDFSDYASYVKLGMQYGARGLPREFVDALKEKHRTTDGSYVGVKQWKLVKDPRAVLDLMAQGYFPHVGSMLAWENTGGPLSRRKGSWAHDMACVGFDDRPEVVERFGETVVFVDQSWGSWNRVTGILPEWEPWGEGMFAIGYGDFAQWIASGECCVMTETLGFEKGESLPWDSEWFPVAVSA